MDANEELVKLLTEQAREGDEAVAAVARVRELAVRSIARGGPPQPIVPGRILEALDGPRVETPEIERLRAIERRLREVVWSDDDPRGTLLRILGEDES